jgi:hypothetical protein
MRSRPETVARERTKIPPTRFHRPLPTLAVADRPKNASLPSRTTHPSRSRGKAPPPKTPHHPSHRPSRRDTHRSCCQTPTQEYVVPRSIPIAGPSALLMFRGSRTRARREVSIDATSSTNARDVSKGVEDVHGLDCVGSHESSMGVWVCLFSHMLVLLSTRVWE